MSTQRELACIMLELLWEINILESPSRLVPDIADKMDKNQGEKEVEALFILCLT